MDMKKNITIISLSLLLVYLLFTNNTIVSTSILNSCHLFLTKVFISLFPMYIISKILINYNFPYYLFKLTKSHYLYLFIMSILSGTPNNAVIIKDLLDRKAIDSTTANKYIMCNFFINPLFLYTMLRNFLDLKTTILIISISYSSNIIIYHFFKSKQKSPLFKAKELSMSELLVKEVSNATHIFLNVLGMIIIFNLISLLIIPKFRSFTGLIEVTNGLSFLIFSSLSTYLKALLSLIFINFGGLCILMQVKTIINNSDIKLTNYLYGRFYATFISTFLFLIINLII